MPNDELQNQLERLTKLKHEMDQYRPLSKIQVRQLEKNTRIEHVWSSNAIEGNHLDRYETASIIDSGVTIHGASVKDILETLDLNEAYEYMMSLASKKEPLSQLTIRDLNRIATLQTAQDKSNAGVYRVVNVWPNGLQNHPYVAPTDIRPQMDQLMDWSNENQNKLHPVIYAADLHQKFVSIHPFIDGNGRTARLLMNFALAQAGYPVINVQPGRKERYDYMERLEKAREGNSGPFEKLIADYAEDELKRRIETLKLNETNIREARNETRLVEKSKDKTIERDGNGGIKNVQPGEKI
ncbi:Fic family protein [Levilactobacillus zymae]|uniref:Fic family protein n=1 Tax=Levilactobacillus zymae TaxID=267363 RepID=UPI003FCE8A9C